MASADGPIKTFPVRGIKDSPPYLHDGRLLTLEDIVEFFDMIQQLKLSPQEKHRPHSVSCERCDYWRKGNRREDRSMSHWAKSKH